jgi:plastocyanin
VGFFPHRGILREPRGMGAGILCRAVGRRSHGFFHDETFFPIMRVLAVSAALGLATGVAIAAEFEVHQSNKVFAPARLVVAKGSVVHFANDENYVHHAFVDTPRFSADTGDIPPGESRDIVFSQAGIYTIACAIHPQMRMTVEVSEKE